MAALPYERPLVEWAQRIRDTRVETDHQEPPPKDPWIRDLWDAGYVRIHFTAAHLRTPDYWRLTESGAAWLAAYSNDSTEETR